MRWSVGWWRRWSTGRSLCLETSRGKRQAFFFKTMSLVSTLWPFSFLRSHSGAQCITCSYKASSGLLYPLERGFIYVHKPPVHLRFEEISCVNFARGTTTTRSFDFEIETKQGNQYTFSSIERWSCDLMIWSCFRSSTIINCITLLWKVLFYARWVETCTHSIFLVFGFRTSFFF